MPRFCCLLEYDGSFFSGWQYQKGLVTVQGCLQDVLFRLTETEVVTYGAGRTDAGVHATGQVAHFDFPLDWKPDTLRRALNFYLKEIPLRVLKTSVVCEEFHARFCASKREYLYLILNRFSDSPLWKNRALFQEMPLDLEAMQKAASYLVGTHDFSSFRSRDCQSASPVKTLDFLDIVREADFLKIRTGARSFLHNQVRIMVGALLKVGRGRWKPDYICSVLEQKDRSCNAPTLPAHALYLTHVSYSPDPFSQT